MAAARVLDFQRCGVAQVWTSTLITRPFLLRQRVREITTTIFKQQEGRQEKINCPDETNLKNLTFKDDTVKSKILLWNLEGPLWTSISKESEFLWTPFFFFLEDQPNGDGKKSTEKSCQLHRFLNDSSNLWTVKVIFRYYWTCIDHLFLTMRHDFNHFSVRKICILIWKALKNRF